MFKLAVSPCSIFGWTVYYPLTIFSFNESLFALDLKSVFAVCVESADLWLLIGSCLLPRHIWNLDVCCVWMLNLFGLNIGPLFSLFYFLNKILFVWPRVLVCAVVYSSNFCLTCNRLWWIHTCIKFSCSLLIMHVTIFPANISKVSSAWEGVSIIFAHI